MPDQVHGAISLACALTIIFFLVPARGSGHGVAREEAAAPARAAPPGSTMLLIACTWISLGYVVFFYQNVLDYSMYGFLDSKGLVLALLICLPLIEAVRRTTGVTLPILVGVLVFGDHLPERAAGHSLRPRL